MRRLIIASTIVAVEIVLSIGIVASGTSGAASARPAGAPGSALGSPLLPTHGGATLPRHGGTVDSLNWSGYAVTPSSDNITAVKSTFVVPTAGAIPPGFAATWVGIGGYNSSDLIQTGVSENSLPDNPVGGDQYAAWYELLPASETQLTDCTGNSGCPVSPGDKVTATIVQAGTNSWTISMADPTENWTWSKTVAYTSTESSAEWILEAPTVGAQTVLADVGTVKFGPTSTYVANGHTYTIAKGSPTKIDLSPGGGVNEATPSALASNGESFNDCAYAQTCAAP
jgi:Peptidase A4 family